jgi:hypothetical protein
LEYTILKSQHEAANFRRWLCRPDCPDVVKDVRTIYDKLFTPTSTSYDLPWEKESVLTNASERAHYTHKGFNYSRSSTHEGNSIIFYKPSDKANERPVPGKIIKIIQRSNGVFFQVKCYENLSQDARDPFLLYQYLQAQTFSSTLCRDYQEIPVDFVVSHAAKYDFTNNRSVFVNLQYLMHF